MLYIVFVIYGKNRIITDKRSIELDSSSMDLLQEGYQHRVEVVFSAALAGKLMPESVIRSPKKNASHPIAALPLFRQTTQHNPPWSSQNAQTIPYFEATASPGIPGCL